LQKISFSLFSGRLKRYFIYFTLQREQKRFCFLSEGFFLSQAEQKKPPTRKRTKGFIKKTDLKLKTISLNIPEI
jgi:hypothetical protein